jgi:hypothetical protein
MIMQVNRNSQSHLANNLSPHLSASPSSDSQIRCPARQRLHLYYRGREIIGFQPFERKKLPNPEKSDRDARYFDATQRHRP